MPTRPSEAALAHVLLQRAATHGTLMAVLRGAGRLQRVARLAAVLGEGIEVIVVPPPDVLPYDLVQPSARVIGRRVRGLIELSRSPSGPRLLLTSATAILQRVRPAVVWREAALHVAPGDALDKTSFRTALARRLYRWDERVDEPGEVALRGQVIDVFPAGDEVPARITLEAGRVRAIARIDPATARSLGTLPRLELRPATEFRVDDADLDGLEARLQPGATIGGGASHRPRRLVPLADLMPGAATYCDPEVAERVRSVRDGIDDAYAAARKAGRLTGLGADLPPPETLFLSAEAALTCCASAISLGRLPQAVQAPHRIDDVLELVRGAGRRRVLLAAPGQVSAVASSLRRRGLEIGTADGVGDVAAGAAGVVEAALDEGIRTSKLLLISVGALLRPSAAAPLAEQAQPPRPGELVVHLEHGMARLEGLVDVGGEDRVKLGYAGEIEALVGADELDRVWRYGEEGGRPDRLDGEAWRRKRAEIEAELGATADALLARARARSARTAPVLSASGERVGQVTRRFAYKLSPDQRAAIHDVTTDLASGRGMDRLLCGDVGFGKTEIAIRAVAASVFAGHQAIVVAPTTVLARQHAAIFKTRFADTGTRIVELIGPADTTARNEAVDGTADIVVGTHGVIGLSPARPGLVVIDEEQRFGEADKAALAALAPHVLAMTATPIPRTMQEALVGLREVSLLATPPQARQPIRTYVLPWDQLVVREALLRERRRGGQSFVVCPRIAELEALSAELGAMVPELSLTIAHGRLKPAELAVAMLGFASGQADVLLATDIIEAGLDIPRANLMLVTHAERFGLAQLHQLRGRVGRGTRTGSVYFLTEPGRKLPPATERRLAAIAAMARLGDGVAISAADLDLRGAGDLFGERQTGHVRAAGTALYQHLLLRALERSRGGETTHAGPELHAGLGGGIPVDYVPEEGLRIALLYRLARLEDPASVRRLALELEDRFGPPPPPLLRLLAGQALRIACRVHGVTRVDAGPHGCALTLDQGAIVLAALLGGAVKDRRVLVDIAEHDPVVRAERLIAALELAQETRAGLDKSGAGHLK